MVVFTKEAFRMEGLKLDLTHAHGDFWVYIILTKKVAIGL